MEFDENFGLEDEQQEVGGEAEGMEKGLNLGEEEEVFIDEYKTKKDVVLFMLDINFDVFLKNEINGEVAYILVLKSLEYFLKTKIVSSPDDRIGLVFYNTGKSNIKDFPHQYLVQDLDCPSAEIILKIKKMLRVTQFVSMCGTVQQNQPLLPLRDIFWNAGSLLLPYKAQDYIRRVFLFTSEDNPHGDELERRKEAVAQAVHLLNSDIGVELFPLRKSNRNSIPFNISKFYSQVTSFEADEINESTVDSSSKIYDLQTRIRTKLFKKRSISRLLWNFGNNVTAGVRVFQLFGRVRLPLNKLVHSETNAPITRIVKRICETTGKVLLPQEVGYSVYVDANTKVKISKDDLQNIKGLEEVGMTLVGFKPSSFLKLYYNYRSSYFIYPDDQLVLNSSQLFHALIMQMIHKDKYAIVKITPRKGGQLRLACLIPQSEDYNPNDHSQVPPGFHVIFLPYADDINQIGSNLQLKKTLISHETVKITSFLVNCLEIQDFDFRNFENPSISQFYSSLQAFALSETTPEKVEDLMQPDQKNLKMYQEVIDLFKECIDIESKSENLLKPVENKKRKRNVIDNNQNDMNQNNGSAQSGPPKLGLAQKPFMSFQNDEEAPKKPLKTVPKDPVFEPQKQVRNAPKLGLSQADIDFCKDVERRFTTGQVTDDELIQYGKIKNIKY